MKVKAFNESKFDKFAAFKYTPALCYAIPFAILFAWFIIAVSINDIVVEDYYMTHYLYTYSRGFVGRGLLGEVLSWFFETINDEIITYTNLFLSFALVVASSLCIGKALNRAIKKGSETFYFTLFFIVTLCVLPITFRYSFTDIKIDKFNLALTLFAVFAVTYKHGIWIAPFLCIIATLLNPVYLFESMIIIAIILLDKFHKSKYSVKVGIICAITYLAMMAIGILGVVSEKWLGFKTASEVYNYYIARYTGNQLLITDEKTLLKWFAEYVLPKDQAPEFIIENYFSQGKFYLFSNLLFISLPLISSFAFFWRRVIKKESDKFLKFIFILCCISPVVAIPASLLAFEGYRYFATNFMAQICLIVYFLVSGNEAVSQTLTGIKEFLKTHIFASGAFAFIYCLLLY